MGQIGKLAFRNKTLRDAWIQAVKADENQLLDVSALERSPVAERAPERPEWPDEDR
jgi:hypothetical protein